MIDRALANGRRVTVVEFDGRIAAAEIRAEVKALEAESAVAEATSTAPAQWTPLDRLEASIAANGSGFRKESEWAAEICRPTDFSVRELERACQHNAIAFELKEDGRDARARLIGGEVLRQYLLLRQAVREGNHARPEWWPKVVQGKWQMTP